MQVLHPCCCTDSEDSYEQSSIVNVCCSAGLLFSNRSLQNSEWRVRVILGGKSSCTKSFDANTEMKNLNPPPRKKGGVDGSTRLGRPGPSLELHLWHLGALIDYTSQPCSLTFSTYGTRYISFVSYPPCPSIRITARSSRDT